MGKLVRKYWTIPLLITLGASLSACSILQRSDSSGYAYRDDTNGSHDLALSYREDRAEYTRDQAANEIGIDGTQELTEAQTTALATRIRLKNAERQVIGRREREQYFKNRPLMKSDLERLEFLSVPTYEGRAHWLNAKNISATNPTYSGDEMKAIETNDVILGMTKQAVKESWGEPEMVEVAGNPVYGNERWKYMQEISSSEGYQTEMRTIYFESGRVAGWEKSQ
jgi:hypothetical protein